MHRRSTRWTLLLFASHDACHTPEPRRPLPVQIARASVATSESEPLGDARARRLQTLLADFARPPFGTGASLSVSIHGQVRSFVTGTLFDGGPSVLDRTPFNVASVSKLVTASLIVSLAHDGRLRLDDTVQQHLPGVHLVDGTGADRAGEITLRQLLRHRAGLPHNPPHGLDPHSVGSSWNDPHVLREITNSWSIALAHETGTFSYSNVGYTLLGAIVERTTGQPFADVARAHLDRLEMHESTFGPPAREQDAPHGRVESHGVVEFHASSWYTSRYALPTGGLWTSMRDLVHFGDLLLAAHGDEASPLHAMTETDVEHGFGLGPLFRHRGGAHTIEHNGSGPGFVAWIIAVPDRSTTFAVACNGGGDSPETERPLGDLVQRMLEVIVPEAASTRGGVAADSRGGNDALEAAP